MSALSLPPRVAAHNEEPPSRTQRTAWQRVWPWLPLLLVLILQAVLSAHLLVSNTAFTDEGLYLWAGRLELLHLFDGAAIPPFPTYFSGAPIVYPPLGALAASLGGLAGARALSLVFMLGASVLLWATTRRLFGSTAACFAAAAWALLGPTIFLGALATFDAMSTFLMALAVYSLVRAAGRFDFVGWTLVAGAALTLANLATYSTIIFDPFLAAIALLVGWRQPTRRAADMKTAAFASYVLTALALLVAAGRTYYWTGLDRTVLARATGVSSVSAVASASWGWTAPVLVAAAVAAVICALVERERATKALVTVLAAAGLVVPIEQARLHTTTSLDKHVDMGAWFAAIAVGYVAARILRTPRSTVVRSGVGLALVVMVLLPVHRAMEQARQMHGWARSTAFVAALRPLAEHSSGPLLIESPSPARYALERTVPWQRWSDTYNITLPNGKSEGSASAVSAAGDPVLYNRLVRRGYFSVIALYGYATPTLDREIERDIAQTRAYSYVTTVRYGSGHYTIWRSRLRKGPKA